MNGGKSTATVTLNDGVKLCEGEPVTLVSYFSPKPEFSVPQYKYDGDTGKITNEQRSVTLKVDVPECNTQVDLFFGGEEDIIAAITENGPRYATRSSAATAASAVARRARHGWYNGGRKACQTRTSTRSPS